MTRRPVSWPPEGRHRAPVIPRPHRRLRKRHVAVVAAAMVGMAWLPAELADVSVPELLAPSSAVAAEETPTTPEAQTSSTAVKASESAVEPRTPPDPSPSGGDPTGATQATSQTTQETPTTATSAPQTAQQPTPVATTTPSRPRPATTTTPRPTRVWPPNCGSAT